MPVSTLLTDLLRGVSRSFYLTLRVLPAAVRPQIGLAYLLARATDTIADTTLLPVERRLAALHDLQARIQGSSECCLNLNDFMPPDPEAQGHATPRDRAGAKAAQTAAAERQLLRRIDDALALLNTLPPDDQQRIRHVLAIITSGQELDLTRFAGASAHRIVSLTSDAELDDYTYRVAGCVGEFWTRLCRAHLFPRANLNDDFLLHAGVRFGKGLQLVNVLRDLPADLDNGRCYLPAQALLKAGLDPGTLLGSCPQERLDPVLRHYRQVAAGHLAAGWAYTHHLPWRCVRVRLACAWPLLIGIRTLAQLERAPLAFGKTPVKISRREIRWLLIRSLLFYPVPWAWNRLFLEPGPGANRSADGAGAVSDPGENAVPAPELGRSEGANRSQNER